MLKVLSEKYQKSENLCLSHQVLTLMNGWHQTVSMTVDCALIEW